MKFLCRIVTSSDAEAKARRGKVQRFLLDTPFGAIFPIDWYSLHYRRNKVGNELVKLFIKAEKLLADYDLAEKERVNQAAEANMMHKGIELKSTTRYIEGKLWPLVIAEQPEPDKEKLERFITFLRKGNPTTAFAQTLKDLDKLRDKGGTSKTVSPSSAKKLTEVGEVNVAGVEFVELSPDIGKGGSGNNNNPQNGGNQNKHQHNQGKRGYDESHLT